MQKISFGNKEYLKASEVAKRFRYTQDYVGQLCRSKKVDARLVGRTWYVEPESVTEYRKTKHATQKGTAVKAVLNKRTGRNTEPKSVVSVIRAKTARSTSTGSHTARHNAISVTYGADNEYAIPIVDKKSPAPERMVSAPQRPVAATTTPPPAAVAKPAKKIKIIRSKDKQRKYVTEKMPEIALSGKLKVEPLVEEPIGKREDPAVLAEASLAAVIGQPVANTPRPELVITSSDADRDLEAAPVAPVEVPRKATVVKEVSSVPANKQKPAPRRSVSRLGSVLFVLASTTLAVIVGALVFTLASIGDVTASGPATWSLFFDLSSLLSLLF